MDAPIYVAVNKMNVDKLPLSSLTGNAVVIDVTEKPLKNRVYLISIADIESWEEENCKIDTNTIVLFRTGYGQFYTDRLKYFGTAKKDRKPHPNCISQELILKQQPG